MASRPSNRFFRSSRNRATLPPPRIHLDEGEAANLAGAEPGASSIRPQVRFPHGAEPTAVSRTAVYPRRNPGSTMPF